MNGCIVLFKEQGTIMFVEVYHDTIYRQRELNRFYPHQMWLSSSGHSKNRVFYSLWGH